jgi:hypothetical protein
MSHIHAQRTWLARCRPFASVATRFKPSPAIVDRHASETSYRERRAVRGMSGCIPGARASGARRFRVWREGGPARGGFHSAALPQRRYLRSACDDMLRRGSLRQRGATAQIKARDLLRCIVGSQGCDRPSSAARDQGLPLPCASSLPRRECRRTRPDRVVVRIVERAPPGDPFADDGLAVPNADSVITAEAAKAPHGYSVHPGPSRIRIGGASLREGWSKSWQMSHSMHSAPGFRKVIHSPASPPSFKASDG